MFQLIDSLVFMPPPLIGVAEALCFQVVRPWVSLCVWACVVSMIEASGENLTKLWLLF